METILFYNLKATGKPRWNLKADHEKQPHITELSAMLVNAETQETIHSVNLVIKPDGWVNDPENGNEDLGISEAWATMMLFQMWQGATRVTFDKKINQKIIKYAIARFLQPGLIKLWANKKKHECIKDITRKEFVVSDPSLTDCANLFVGVSADTEILNDNLCMIRNVYFASKIKALD